MSSRQAESYWPAPAKLNLFLHVTGRRHDGYHSLQTVFQFLDYADELRFSLRKDGRIERVNDVPGIDQDNDLTLKAARLLQRFTNSAYGVDIENRKHLPIGGGLGGGSSNAATTLLVLDKLWACNLSQQQLQALALKLGADVPIFVFGQAAWAEGVGDKFHAVELPEHWYVVVNPSVTVSTAELFAAPQLTRNCPPITIHDFLSGKGENVFEPVVRDRYPEVDEVLTWLSSFATARLTGTGSCVFAAFDSKARADRVLTQVPVQWQAFVARGRNCSPLMPKLASSPAMDFT